MDLFKDRDVQTDLLAMLVWDRQLLRSVGDIITQDDFRPLAGRDSIAWLIAGISLEFYQQHRVPVGSLLSRELEKWAKQSGVGDERKQKIKQYLIRLKKTYDPTRSNVLQSQVLDFKKDRARQNALRELVELERLGTLTDERWLELMRTAMDEVSVTRPQDYLARLEQRVTRRNTRNNYRTPVLMIDPLDMMIRSIGRGHIGLWLALYKAGKSLALIWIAVSYLFQGLNVLFFTLEDPIEDVEDRLDACIAEMPIENLGADAETLRRRFKRFSANLRSRIRVVDGTDGGYTIAQIESIWERERALGFDADVVVVDYDDEIRVSKARPDRRQEFADIYRDFRKFAARRQIIAWTAAQAVRGAEGKKVVTASMTAEDISKMRKVTMGIGIGQGEWGDDSRYLYVAVHKFDRQKCGCTIWAAPEKAIFYDRAKTLLWMERERKENGG